MFPGRCYCLAPRHRLLIAETLGVHSYPRFLASKRREWDPYRIHVTDWELECYRENLQHIFRACDVTETPQA